MKGTGLHTAANGAANVAGEPDPASIQIDAEHLRHALGDLGWPVEAAAELTHGAHIVQYERRSIIFRAGESADLLYILLTGVAKLHFDAGDAASLLVSIPHGGQMLGVFAPDGEAQAPAEREQLFTASALSRCDVAIIPTARMVEVLRHLPAEKLVHVLEHDNEQWMHLCCRLMRFMTMGVRGRLTYAIGEIADCFGVPDEGGRRIPLRLSHEDLAALVGASRPMVSKHLKDLGADGVLTKQHGRYLVLSSLTASTANGNGIGPSRADSNEEHFANDVADRVESG